MIVIFDIDGTIADIHRLHIFNKIKELENLTLPLIWMWLLSRREI